MHVEERQVWATPDSSCWRGAHMQHRQRLLPSLTDTCLLLQKQAEQFHWYCEYSWYPMNSWGQCGTCSVLFLTFHLPKAHCSQEIINTLKSHNQIQNLYPAGLIDNLSTAPSLPWYYCASKAKSGSRRLGQSDAAESTLVLCLIYAHHQPRKIVLWITAV